MELLELVDNHGQIYGAHQVVADAIASVVPFRPVVISWCDGHGTRLTVLFAIPTKVGIVPGLNPVDTWLYVAIEGYGTYGFAIRSEALAPGYIAEKLGRGTVNPTWETLAELVNNIRRTLSKEI